MEVSTPTFIAEYDTRPNRLFIEYLNHPKEVLGMLWGLSADHSVGHFSLRFTDHIVRLVDAAVVTRDQVRQLP